MVITAEVLQPAAANLAAGVDSGAVQSSVAVTHLNVQVKSQAAGQATGYSVKLCASSL